MKTQTAVAAALLATLSLAAGAVGRSADVALVDRATGRELPVYWHEGRAFVVGKPGSEYKIVVRNRLREDLLAVVSVDGVNVVSGQTASPDQGGYVIAPRDRTDIKGWRKSLGRIASFYFTSLGDSYAGATGRPDNVGVIGVALFERANRYEPPADLVPYESWGPKREGADQRMQPVPQAQQKHGRAAPSAPLGTGHGRSESSAARPTEFERATDEPMETIAIYYDSYRNLVAQGVIRAAYGRRDPDPFPTRFAADPPRYRW